MIVPDRNQILYCRVFQVHHQVQSRIHMHLVDAKQLMCDNYEACM